MAAKEFDCLVIGDVILDIFLKGTNNHLPFLKGGTSYCEFAKIEFGGAGNVAVGIRSLGGKAAFIGKAGDDLWGRMYEKDLRANGVITAMLFEKKTSTGLAFVNLQEDGERSFCVFRGANDWLSVDEIDKSVRLLKRSKYLYFSGYSLVANPQRDATLHSVRLAKKHNKKVFFDPSAHNLVKSNFELFKELLNVCDVFCPNIDEAKAITKTFSVKTAVLELQKTRKLVFLKGGEDGCFLISEDTFVKIPGYNVRCRDSTGAGDAFNAAVVFGLVNGFPLKFVGQLANWFASYAIRNTGARNYPKRREINGFFGSSGLAHVR